MQISPRPSPFFTFTIARSYGDLAGVSKVNDDTMEFQLNTPNPSMVFTMSNFFSSMFSPAFFAENGDFTGIPAATGPFSRTGNRTSISFWNGTRTIGVRNHWSRISGCE